MVGLERRSWQVPNLLVALLTTRPTRWRRRPSLAQTAVQVEGLAVEAAPTRRLHLAAPHSGLAVLVQLETQATPWLGARCVCAASTRPSPRRQVVAQAWSVWWATLASGG